MATISSAGIGSGLDVTTIISKLMAAESQPLTQIKADATKIQSKISAYGKIQSYVSALQDAAQTLADPTAWSKTTAASADEKVFTATSTGAAAGSYAVQVTALAQGQTLFSTPFASATATVGSGTLSIELGQWSGDTSPSFTPKADSTAVEVAIAATDTLQDVRNKINAAGAGVTASIVTDAAGSRLVMRSTATGVESGFRVAVADDDGTQDGSGLSSLAYDPSAGISELTLAQAASNAEAVIDGIPVSSTTNKIDGAIGGVTLQLTGVSTSAVGLTLADDTTTMQTNVEAFVKAYNDLSGYLTTQTKYDESSKSGGPLQGDSGTNSLRSAMRTLITSVSGTSSSYSQLFQVGIDTNQDGTLKTDSTKLKTALASPEEMKKLFSRNAAGTSDDGIGEKLQTWSDALLSFDGSVTTRSKSLQKQLDANTKKQDDFNDRLTRIQAQLEKQYSALDTQMSSLNQLSTYVTQQITAWNKSS